MQLDVAVYSGSMGSHSSIITVCGSPVPVMGHSAEWSFLNGPPDSPGNGPLREYHVLNALGLKSTSRVAYILPRSTSLSY